MKTETTLAKNLASAGEKASYDAACKRLLANKMILSWILKSCVEEYRDCEIEEIAEKYIEGMPQIAQTAVHPDEEMDTEQIRGAATEDATIREGTVTYDIRFYAIVPGTEERMRMIINIEAQNDFYPGYPILKRAMYYCSRMISSQYETEFHGSHYEKIKKVYSIWICMNPPGKRKNSMNRYSVREEHLVGKAAEAKENYDLLTAVMICLGDAEEPSTGLLKLLEVLLSSEREAEEKKKILQEDFEIKMTRDLESEVSVMCNLSKGVEEKGIAKGIAQGMAQGIEKGKAEGMAQGIEKGKAEGMAQGIEKGMAQGIEKGKAEGMAQGIEKGMTQGIEKGMARGTLSAIRNLMESMGWSAEQAMDALRIPEAEREDLKMNM